MGNSRVLKLATWIVLVPVLLVAGLLAYIHFGDLNWLKPRIEAAVAAHTGFDLSLAGDFDLALFPGPALLIENASLDGASPEVGDVAVSLGHLSGQVRMRSIIDPPIRITDLTITNLDVVRVAGEPRATPGPSAGEGSFTGLPVLIESAELTGIALSNQSPTGQVVSARLDSAAIQQETTDRVALTANGTFSGVALAPADIPVRASLKAHFRPGSIGLDDMHLQVGDNTASGNLSISTGKRLGITGVLNSDKMDLSPLFVTGADGEPLPGAGGTESSASTRYVFGEQRLPFAALRNADIDLRLRHEQLLLERFLLLDVHTYIKLEEGELLLTNSFDGPEGGRLSSRLEINASDIPASITADIKARDLRLNLISGDISDKSAIPPTDITVDLAATGNSPRELAASSNGRVLVSLRQGRIANNMVGLFIGDFMKQLFGKLNPFAEQDGYSSLQCTIVGMDITDGNLDFTGMLLQTEKVKAIGDGSIDLHTEELKVDFETQPREGLGISASMFVTPFIGLDGTLAAPRMSMRKKSALVAVATGGLSLLAKGVTGRAAGPAGECLPLIEQVGGHPPID